MRYILVFILAALCGCGGKSPNEIALEEKCKNLETRVKTLEAACASFLTAEARDASNLVQETKALAQKTHVLVHEVKADGERQKAILADTQYHNRLTQIDGVLHTLNVRIGTAETNVAKIKIDRSFFKKKEGYSCQCSE